MSSRRRSRSRDRGKLSSGPSKLRMDSKPQTPRITDPSLPAGRRREIDNVMKKARASPNSNSYWDKKLLEVEAKDPNRIVRSSWRHSGYKSMYLDGSSSPSSGRRSRSRSPAGRRNTPMARRSPAGRRSPRSPPSSSSRRSPIGRRPSPRSPPPSSRRSPIGRRSSPPQRPMRPRSPPPSHKNGPRRSHSGSSVSSCSDDSCSVCSPKIRGGRSRSRSLSVPRSRAKGHPKGVKKVRARPPSPSPSPPPPRRVPRPMTPPPARRPIRPTASTSSSDRPTDPRRQPPPPRPRNRSGEIIDVSGVKPPPPKGTRKPKEKEPVLLTRIKKERTKKRPGSPGGGGGGESSGSEDSSNSSTSAIVATTRLTLSERFGKMAQWSVDRERRDIENMRITKTGGDLKVMIEEDDFLYGSPPRRYSISPVPAGHFPDELLGSGASRMAGWDDVRVRYQYYKDLGYLRDLSLDDYVKWEEWWYKYQDWLANERHYEHWLSTQNRRRRKRLPATQRLN